MNNGKIRSKQHILGDKAIKFLYDVFPDAWVIRQLDPDYGIDLDVELFDYEDDKCITLGEHVFFQVKGTENPQYITKKLNGYQVDVLAYPLEVSELNLVERMGSAFPVLLVVVDLVDKKGYFLCLNDYIKKVLPNYNMEYKKQKTISIYIPVKNIITKDEYLAIRWYGIRNKIYAMFHEMLSDIRDIYYSENKYISLKQFIEYYKNYDVIKRGTYWTELQTINEQLIELSNNNYIYPIVFNRFNTEYFDIQNYHDQLIDSSIFLLSENINNACSLFESYCRTWFMPGLPLGVFNEKII